jgi:excisionase family DNA binding protein
MNDTDRLLTAQELAEALGVSISTVRRMTRDGQIPVVRLRGAVRYDLVAVVRTTGSKATAWPTDGVRIDPFHRE